MPILVKPFLGCNLNCSYCYERDYRNSEGSDIKYDLNAVLSTIERLQPKPDKEGKVKPIEVGLHGGEPLCLPKSDVEAILSKAYEITCHSGIQTNGTLIDKDHIEMFKRYKTNVGISLDGPGELSKFRLSEPEANRIDGLIRELVEEGINVSLISVISRSNAGTDALFDEFKVWIKELSILGIGGRINPCSNYNSEHELDAQRLTEVYLNLCRFCTENGLSWSPFIDMASRVRNEPAVCVFMGCDPLYTESATVVLGDGSVSNCMRTNHYDITIRDRRKYFTRDEILQDIPQEHGGCRGCEFWYACHGGCPSMAIEGDWRNRTTQCPMYKEMFKYLLGLTIALGLPIRTEQETRTIQSGKSGHTDVHRDTPHVDTWRRQ